MISGDRVCGCCGAKAYIWIKGRWARCRKHDGRNPCAIEGCQRTTEAKARHLDDWWLCTEHWKRYCPPGSRARKAYHSHLRRSRKFGWTDEAWASFVNLWGLIIRRARRRAAEGHVDMAEINKAMGWSADGEA